MSAEPPTFRLRGTPGADDSLRIYQMEGLALSLRCEIVRGHVLVYGIIAQGYDAAQAILVRLLTDAEATLVAETLVEAGSFELGPMSPGRYGLEVLLPDRLLVLPAVSLPPSPEAAPHDENV